MPYRWAFPCGSAHLENLLDPMPRPATVSAARPLDSTGNSRGVEDSKLLPLHITLVCALERGAEAFRWLIETKLLNAHGERSSSS